MQEKKLNGTEALMVIQCYAVLKAINEDLSKRVQAIVENGYTEDVAAKMSREAFVAITISNEMYKLGQSMTNTIKELTGLQGDALKLDIVQFPEINIKSIEEK